MSNPTPANLAAAQKLINDWACEGLLQPDAAADALDRRFARALDAAEQRGYDRGHEDGYEDGFNNGLDEKLED